MSSCLPHCEYPAHLISVEGGYSGKWNAQARGSLEISHGTRREDASKALPNSRC